MIYLGSINKGLVINSFFNAFESVERSIIYLFGSLIIWTLLQATVQFIRYWLQYTSQMKKKKIRKSKITSEILYSLFKML
ncbi:unnamed protein product [Paramecium octaurelia]|uniref:Uncharacterized protein n=1 Tax=Paramecium octaurelia TaxID=43137 RepID=A0A8S1TPI7_PAROT|nr:unnamed protein product [Paramecium octaurelia]